LLYNADEQNDADESYQRKINAADEYRKQCADAGTRQRGENGDRMNVTFVENSQHDVDDNDRRQDQQWLTCQRRTEFGTRAGKLSCDRVRQTNLTFCFLNRRERMTQRTAAAQIERDGRGRKLPLVRNR